MHHPTLAVTTLLCLSQLAFGQVVIQSKAGDPLQGLTPEQLELFWAGREAYSTARTAEQGLGPIHNKTNCVSCHGNPAGGWGSITVTRFGNDDKGEFVEYPGETQSLLQALALSSYCAEVLPADATVVTLRMTNSSMAFGMIDAIADADIAANQDPTDANADGISGRVHWVEQLEAPTGPLRAGRYGWKAQVATTLSFSADATRNEMGVTSDLVPTENPPNGDFARLTECDMVAEPEDTADASGYRFIDRVTHFQRYLAPPPQTPKSGMTGEGVFMAIGCGACHIPAWQTINDASLEAPIRQQAIRPYSDFLLHNMGGLGDGVQQGDADETEMRTPTLWNLRTRDPMLHNGAASGGVFATRVTKAIELHGPFGEGAASAANFAALSDSNKAHLVKFLESLGRLEFDLVMDNQVDELDFPSFRDCYNAGATGPDAACGVADFNQDGLVDMTDVNAFAVAYDGKYGTGDCDGDGTMDLVEVLLGAADDNGDLMPDNCQPCAGDLTGDGIRDGADLAIVLAAWGTADADIDGDGITNGVDLGTLLAGWGACN